MKPKPKAKSTPASKSFGALEIITLLLAIYGAGLSTWVLIQEQREDAPRVYVRLNVEANDKATQGQSSAVLTADLANVGKLALSIAPRVRIEVTDHNTGKKRVERKFLMWQSGDQGKEALTAGMPATLKPGQSAGLEARTNKLKPKDSLSVLFELSDHSRFRASFTSVNLRSWSAGSFAEEVRH